MRVQRIGPYRLEERIGRGGMAEVFRARDERLKRWVAIKQIRLDSEDPERHRRFRREAQAAAQLNHSAIVQIHDFLQTGDGDWIVMEYIEGQTLSHLLRDGPVPLGRGLELARQIAAGLSEAHAQGIIHRDLKTENVMVTPAWRAKILDFGLAKRLAHEETDGTDTDTWKSLTGRIVGTSRAMSPEQAQGFDVDSRSDLFSLGILYYETFTGLSPFKGSNHLDTLDRVCNYRQPPVRDCDSALPRKLSALIDRLLEKNPARRPQSADEVVVSLDGVESDESDVSDTVPVVVDGKLPERPSSRRENRRPVAAPREETTRLGRPRPSASRAAGGRRKPFWHRLTLPATLARLWRRATGSRQGAVDSQSSNGRSPRVASS